MSERAEQWKTVSLDSLAEFRNGINYTKENFGKGIKVVNVKDFGERTRITTENLDEVDPQGLIRDKDLLRDGDVLFVRSNGNRQLIGRSVLITGIEEPITHSAFTIRARFTSDQVLPRFYAYLFRSQLIRQILSAHGSGTNISNLNQRILSQLKVPVPPLSTQRRIAGILSAYDDLIENNTRRIEILEEMAHAIYREWFVHFRFPGHEDVEMAESELGQVPAGWEVMPVTDAVEVNPRESIPRKTEKPYVPMASLNTDSMVLDLDELETRKGKRAPKFRNDDTLFARITPSLENGKTGFVQFMPTDDTVARGSSELIVLRSKTLCPQYVYFLARSHDFRQNAIKSMTGASGRQRVQLSCFDGFHIAHPDRDTLDEFEQQVSPMFRLIHTLTEKNQNLRRTRDLLLPRLVSGKVDVAELNEPAPATM